MNTLTLWFVCVYFRSRQISSRYTNDDRPNVEKNTDILHNFLEIPIAVNSCGKLKIVYFICLFCDNFVFLSNRKTQFIVFWQLFSLVNIFFTGKKKSSIRFWIIFLQTIFFFTAYVQCSSLHYNFLDF